MHSAVIESIGVESGGREFYCWLLMPDGRLGLWVFDIRRPPGQMQTLTIFENV